MAEYTEGFADAGLTELRFVAYMSVGDMERAGITKTGHKKKLQKQRNSNLMLCLVLTRTKKSTSS